METRKGMTAGNATPGFGWRVYGLGVMALGLVCLAWGNFDPAQPVPKNFPDRTALAYAVAAFMFVAGAAIEWRRIAATAAWLSPSTPSSAIVAGPASAFFVVLGLVVLHCPDSDHVVEAVE